MNFLATYTWQFLRVKTWCLLCDISKLQKFDNRKSVIRDEELKYWEQLSLDYMTEESDDASDPNCIVEHKLPWRSSGRLTYIPYV